MSSSNDLLIRASLMSPSFGPTPLVIGGGGITENGQATLSNKEFIDNSVLYVDDADSTKKIAFELSGLTTGTTRTLTAPDANGTIALLADVGEVNTGSNLTATVGAGESTASVFKAKSGVDLQFNQIRSLNNRITAITNTDSADLTLNESNLVIANMSDASSYATLTGTEVLTNKTLTTPKIYNNANTFTYNLTAGNITANRNIGFGLLLQDDVVLFQHQPQNAIDGAKTFVSGALRMQDGTGLKINTITASNNTVNVNANIPALTTSDDFVFATHAQSLTNKTIAYANNTLTGVQPTILVEYAESEALSTTTSATYIQKLRLTTTSLVAGNYYLSWYAEICNTNGDKEMSAKIEQNDSNVIGECFNVTKLTTNDAFHTFSGIKKLASVSGVQTFDIDFRADSNTAQIKRARIKISSV